jgi:hypothetical protein
VDSAYEPLETARLIDLVLACLALFIVAPFVEDSTLWLKLGGWWSIGPVGPALPLWQTSDPRHVMGASALRRLGCVSAAAKFVGSSLVRVMQVHEVGSRQRSGVWLSVCYRDIGTMH